MNLKHLKTEDYPNLKHFFIGQTYNLCVYSLPSILVWNSQVYQPCGVIQDDSLIVAAEFEATHADKRHLILPVSPNRAFSPEELYEIAEKLGFDKYWFVPDEYIESFGKTRIESLFEIREDEKFQDYVYLREDLAELKGNRYSKKRNLISQFKKAYDKEGGIAVEKITNAVVPECIAFLEKWCKERDCDKEPGGDLSCEKRAAINMLENIELLEVPGILLRLDGIVSAFGIASHLNKDMGVLHFEKAFANIKGLYQYFDQLCAKLLFSDKKYINKESDMGMPSLAQAKDSYHPVMKVRAYELKVRS
jgi:hypothetical protein